MHAQEPIDVVRRAWDVAERDGVPALIALVAEDVVWKPLIAPGRELRGRADVEAFARELERTGTEVTISGGEFEARGDTVIVTGRVRVYSRHGHYDERMHWRVDVRDARIAGISSSHVKSELTRGA